MANAKKAASNGAAKAKETVNKVINQAKESLKVLEALEKETLAKAKVLVNVKLPNREETKKLTNAVIIENLKKLGVATQSEVETLKSKISALEEQIAQISSSKSKSTSSQANV
ncbi:MAG: hypothetical protein JNL01_09455 [Bdellovibrionales bacterium]|nr:hypothetical protein [Bdellovibrionales bacterium]